MTAVDERREATGPRLAERILANVRQQPADARGRLPTERRLAEDLGVSRTSIRHALARLEAAGLLSREVGRGTFLRTPETLPPADVGAASLVDVAPADVMAARALIEPHAMGLAVLRATERDLDEMERSLKGGDAAESFPDFEAWDRALHRCLIAATHNPLLITLYATVDQARESQVWGQIKRRSDSSDRRTTYRCDHRAIVDAVRARDRDGAIEAMHAHLAKISVNLFGTVVY